MKPKLILCLALVLSGVLTGCSIAAQQHESANGNGLRWGEVVAGFQMATSLDESNGMIHCRIRNATTDEMDYPSFDFGYFENVHLEIKGASKWTKQEAVVFPRANGYSSAFPYLLKRIKPGQIVTNTFVRERFHPWPELKLDEYLKWHPGNTNEAMLEEAIGRRLSAREALLTRLSQDDTFALDLIGEQPLTDFSDGKSLEVRVSQEFRVNEAMLVTVYSPVFTLNGSLIQNCEKRNRELFGKWVLPKKP